MSDRYPQYLSSQEPTAGIQHTASPNPILALNRIPAEEIARMAPADQSLDRVSEPPSPLEFFLFTCRLAWYSLGCLTSFVWRQAKLALGSVKARPVGAAKTVAMVSLKCLIGFTLLLSAFFAICILSLGGAQ